MKKANNDEIIIPNRQILNNYFFRDIFIKKIFEEMAPNIKKNIDDKKQDKNMKIF